MLSLIHIWQIRIKAPTTDTLCRQLSGGNQQKVVVAKALTSKPRILIFDEPTQGIDVGAKAEIYEPVSYTHLAVYKRQYLCLPMWRPALPMRWPGNTWRAM